MATPNKAEEITYPTWLAEAFAQNPDQIFNLDPFDESVLKIDPSRNARGSTPEIGDKSLTNLIANIEEIGQSTPCFATLDENGVAWLYAGFRRARAIQTLEKLRRAAKQDNPWLLRVLITPGMLSELEVMERSLSENVFRDDLTMMQKAVALNQLVDNGLTLEQAGVKMNMKKSTASIYARFVMFPAITKKAMTSGVITYNGAEKMVALLPTRKQLSDEPEEQQGELLKAAQDKIAALTQKLLLAGGGVGGAKVDKATRKMKDAKGGQANKRQRKPSLILQEIGEQLAVLKPVVDEGENKEVRAAAGVITDRLTAIKKYIGGGIGMKALVKALES